ncbi:exo-beta-N-acetylmuramidase NamZ domain-containing protein [Weeksella virosa]|uniref:Uncharacterized conserved protein UCP016719 n=1 Tax=Weeksella virosa (strain ATCC 43766 / DSM 16922 / JCM 21250 / CCUG 30538 / CDC 9751 / IAM 14551 / NBRC 16016 / NCTC 11634 / CL345/78) TaxID=865938 RepID=F0NZX6_WEEVC|nr:DUF1343 domain-containing protein [Weeksella virosa]ADX68400.1 Uncharacterized conserved protein UCP016719 [Weeksella virosa DSM 16922]VEH63946.1 Uncharacterized protein conserved in bacteria [Weeksella virosa]
MKNFVKYTLIALLLPTSFCVKAQKTTEKSISSPSNYGLEIITGAENSAAYIALLQHKNIGVVANQTSIVRIKTAPSSYQEHEHLVDFLLKNKINVLKIFSPEHGFRGEADAGAKVNSSVDEKTQIPIISLYGKNKKPSKEQLSGIDVLVFDMQDVGARFYTYISTLHYVMEAAAENNKEIIVLDRPNPNAHYIDGPILQPKFRSFVGMHPVPIVYGMTIGEYAQMINGEGWLNNRQKAKLTVIPLKNYTHQSRYSLPVKPSPNLPNDRAINLYPSTCLFEGTQVNEGRGTEMQFQVYGSPYLKNMPYQYTPISRKGASDPKFKNQLCFGENLSETPYLDAIDLRWLIRAYTQNTLPNFWTKNGKNYWIDQLSGTDALRMQIEKGLTQEQIKATWEEGLKNFRNTRQKYLLYKD